jgi:hypothetical protein
MKRIVLSSLLLLTSLGAQATLIRSAGLYYVPGDEIEATTNVGYLNRERRFNGFQSKSSVTVAGARFEHGLNDKVSWGATMNYGSGSGEISSVSGKFQQSYQGLFNPETFVKYHLTNESYRLHANGIFSIKNDSMVLGSDRNPINFASGGSALALQIGAEKDFGPTTFGADVRTDLWKDTQEIVQRDSSVISYQTEAIYFRDGGKTTTASLFGEMNKFKNVKTGVRVRATQLESSLTTPQSNPNLTTSSTALQYKLPKEQIISTSLYGRVRLPKQFVLNLELSMNEFYLNSSMNDMIGRNYGLFSSLGYKF